MRTSALIFLLAFTAVYSFSQHVPAKPFVRVAANKTLSDPVLVTDDIIKIPAIIYRNGFDQSSNGPAKDSLNIVAMFLRMSRELTVEIGVHTDSRGTDIYNDQLSQARARWAMEYLLKKGVPSTQISCKGYGEKRLLISDEEIAKLPTKEKQEEAHQKNSRTELKVMRVVRDLHSREYNKGDIIQIPEIIYNLDGGLLSHPSNPKDSIKRIVTFLKEHVGLIIEVGSHTGSRATDAYNFRLSEVRAKCVADYIISMGIPRERVLWKGYGKSQLLFSDEEIASFPAGEEQENLHQKNRRTELKVMATDYEEGQNAIR